MIKTKTSIFSLSIFVLALFPVTSAAAAPNDEPFKLNCKSTKAKGHAVRNVIPPKVKAPFRNRIINMSTNCGEIVIEAFGVNAPVTVTAMTALAKSGFFDQTLCHRLTTEGIYVLQCGDPTATGRGRPNFSYNDENLPPAADDNYPAGTVAMANSGANTNGSQFFIVYEDTSLSPNYTIWGKVVRGLDIVKAIARDGVVDGKTDGLPKRKIAIERVKVR
jgi:peptidyl-prolyl cis-trans isomerase B (cyclophilin B)